MFNPGFFRLKKMVKYFATYCLFVCKDPYKDQHFDIELNVLGDPQRIKVHMLFLLRINCVIHYCLILYIRDFY